MKLILTLEQEIDRKVYRTTIVKEQPETVELHKFLPIFREAALAVGFHPDNVDDYLPPV